MVGRIPWSVTAICENIQDLLSDGKTPYERRFGIPFNGPVIPLGAMVEYHLVSAKDISRLHQFGPKILARCIPRLCIVCGENLERDIMIADIGELEEMDASEIHARRLKTKEVLTPMKVDTFIFPVADGTVTTLGGDRRLRPSTLIRDHQRRGTRSFSRRIRRTLFSKPSSKMTQHEMMRKLKMTSGLL